MHMYKFICKSKCIFNEILLWESFWSSNWMEIEQINTAKNKYKIDLLDLFYMTFRNHCINLRM